jgi:hypothetical protein
MSQQDTKKSSQSGSQELYPDSHWQEDSVNNQGVVAGKSRDTRSQVGGSAGALAAWMDVHPCSNARKALVHS